MNETDDQTKHHIYPVRNIFGHVETNEWNMFLKSSARNTPTLTHQIGAKHQKQTFLQDQTLKQNKEKLGFRRGLTDQIFSLPYSL